MRALFFALAVSLAGPNPARASEVTVEERLSQPVVVRETGDYLLLVLARLSKKTGVRLKVRSPLADSRILCRYEGTLSGFMDALAQFYAVDKAHPAVWDEEGGVYTLERDPKALAALQALRKERQEETVQALEAALCTQNPVTLPLKVLDREHRGAVYAGGQVEVSPGAPNWQELREELLAHGDWPATTRMVVSLVGTSRQTRRLAWRWLDDEKGQGQEETAWLHDLAPELGAGPQGEKWLKRCGFDRKDVAAPASEERVLGWSSQGEFHRGEALLLIADHFKINLIAEDHGQTISRTQLSSRGIPVLLDTLCQPVQASMDAPGYGLAYFWRKAGDVYLIRSLDWPEAGG